MPAKPIKEFDDDELVSEAGRYFPGEIADAELQRRLMESIRNLDKTTADYSQKILILTFVLALIGIEQLVLTTFPIPQDFWTRVVVGFCSLGAILYVFWDLTRKEDTPIFTLIKEHVKKLWKSRTRTK